jgi:hypothetical protein
LLLGNVAEPEEVEQLPDHTFDVVLSRRGPNVTDSLLAKLKPEVYVIQELHQDPLGLLQAFGRKSVLDQVGYNPRWLVETYGDLQLFPVSIKEYYYDFFFRDTEHLAAYLSQGRALFSWPMPPMPYEEQRDRAALELYGRYNTTPKGIRIVNHRQVYLFRRTVVQYAPAAPEVKPFD